MAQYHGVQHGMFHITTNTCDRIPWCVIHGVPEIIIDNLSMTRNIQKAQLHAFCILPDHLHIIITTGLKGLSAFMHSFKKNTSRDIHNLMGSDFRIAAAERIHSNADAAGKIHSTVAAVRKPPWMEIQKPPLIIDAYDENTIIRWQKGYHDERIRSGDQCSAVMGYVQGNAMKHGIVSDILDWPWTSLHFPELLDPMEMWLD